MKYETVIGLEVHIELATKSKLFCACANRFGDKPNTLTCPVCLGLPGALPVLNEQAVELALRAAVALGARITPHGDFDRKHYFYPDLPKGYQITQWRNPIGRHGSLEIRIASQVRRIGIIRLHLEEDAGKLIHGGEGEGSSTLVDFNRSGVPLIEIVTEPELRSPAEARRFLETLKTLMRTIGVSDCRMQEGSLRCDANISLRVAGSPELGVKTELKNVNSFRNIERGLAYEQARQARILEQGGQVTAETRRWDDKGGVTVVMRGKETSRDYLYLPEPDLGCLTVTDDWVEEIRRQMPELPQARYLRLMDDYGLTEDEATLLVQSPAIADFLDQCVMQGGNPKICANWVLGEVLRLLNAAQMEPEELSLSPTDLVDIIHLVRDGTLSAASAKQLLAEVFTSGRRPGEIMEERGLQQVSDSVTLSAVLRQVFVNHPTVAAELVGGKARPESFLIGQVMKNTQGKANPAVVRALLAEWLAKERGKHENPD